MPNRFRRRGRQMFRPAAILRADDPVRWRQPRRRVLVARSIASRAILSQKRQAIFALIA